MSLCSTRRAAEVLVQCRHYLGPTKSCKFAWEDEHGVMVFAAPRARHLPHDRWLELTRWALYGHPNGGSQMWGRFRRWAMINLPDITTLVSYSDPSVGHTGALYKACNWQWAPTWHRLFPPPTGNGSWKDGEQQNVKDRWIFPLRPDAERQLILSVKDTRARLSA